MYENIAEDYDRFVNWKNRLAYEMPFLINQIEKIQSPPGKSLQILETACGTAMHAIALAKLGHRLSAADISPQMVEKSRLNARESGIDLQIKIAGFGSLSTAFGGTSFDLLLCLGNSLPHLLTPDKLKESLVDFAACLRPGGMLIIQNRNFDAVMTNKDRWMEPQVHVEGEMEWVFQRFYDFQADGLIRFNIVTLKRSNGADWRAALTSTLLRPQLQKELVDALSSTGFGEILSFGSLGGDPFDPLNSGNLVLTAIKI